MCRNGQYAFRFGRRSSFLFTYTVRGNWMIGGSSLVKSSGVLADAWGLVVVPFHYGRRALLSFGASRRGTPFSATGSIGRPFLLFSPRSSLLLPSFHFTTTSPGGIGIGRWCLGKEWGVALGNKPSAASPFVPLQFGD